MAAYFCCLTAGGGVPIFIRVKGNIKPLPYAVLGSLAGVHMFAANHDVELHSTCTEDSKIVWKEFHNSITLIMVSQDDNSSDVHMQRLLEYVFQAMVLVYGKDELITIKNVDRFKKEIRVTYSIVDKLLEGIESSSFAETLHTTELIASPDIGILQTYLDAFVNSAHSPYGCLFVNGKVVVATKKWWELTALEQVLLSLFISSLTPCSSRDIPIFLPVGSPTVPHRLLTLQLIPGVEVCLVCGPSPSLAELERETGRFWKSALDSLKTLILIQPRNFPSTISVDKNALGFLLINRESHRSLCSVCPSEEDARKFGKMSPSSMERTQCLKAFYKSVVGNLIRAETAETDRKEPCHDIHRELSHTVLDTYICADTHKCYSLQQNPHQLFVMYKPSIPTYAMRSTTLKLLQACLKDKSCQQLL